MDASLTGLVVFWALALIAAAAAAFALATGRLNLGAVLTGREWTVTAKLVGIALLTLVIIYFHNAARYAGKDFIYGRF